MLSSLESIFSSVHLWKRREDFPSRMPVMTSLLVGGLTPSLQTWFAEMQICSRRPDPWLGEATLMNATLTALGFKYFEPIARYQKIVGNQMKGLRTETLFLNRIINLKK